MPGMNPNAYTVSVIAKELERVESSDAATAMEALGVLDEIRRLERKWREQVARGGTRRTKADFATLHGWYRRWLLAARAVGARDAVPQLQTAITQTESLIAGWSAPDIP